MLGILNNTRIVRHSNGVTAGTTAVTPSAGVDVQGYNSVAFLVLLGTITSTGVPSIKVQQSDDNGSADAFDDLAGSAFATNDTQSNGIIAVEIMRPTKRYLRVVVTRATANVVLDGIVAILSNPMAVPITPATLGNEVHVTPLEGTA